MIGMNNELNASSQPSLAHAQRNFARLMAYVANFYCMGGSSSVSAREMVQLTASVAYLRKGSRHNWLLAETGLRKT